jgi:CheY-like chemotaxis protein
MTDNPAAWRTLIVDDEPLAREGIRARLVTLGGFDVVDECSSGRDAIVAIRSRLPDLVFLDVQMPIVDGFAVISEIGADAMPATRMTTTRCAHSTRRPSTTCSSRSTTRGSRAPSTTCGGGFARHATAGLPSSSRRCSIGSNAHRRRSRRREAGTSLPATVPVPSSFRSTRSTT